MMPIKDINPTHTKPVVTRLLVGINIIIFIVTFFNPRFTDIIDMWGFRPIYLYTGIRLETIFTSMFLHGDIHHIFGNMLYLWIFGDNVEDALGHGKYLMTYLVSGVAASAIQSIFSPISTVPMIGASGAISGILGMYLLFYPRARIVTLLFLGYFITTTVLPAFHYIWFWFIMQFILGSISILNPIPVGVAYWAHIGGFVTGLLIGAILYNTRQVRLKRMEYLEYILY
ncbi:TPA: rhomboid family intramembrane serine protease [Candidatus Geothermarchaeota archaeon]|nr:rhomboid family intramembrane serine protease [Candidatus Geothermarchaeota archaeon]